VVPMGPRSITRRREPTREAQRSRLHTAREVRHKATTLQPVLTPAVCPGLDPTARPQRARHTTQEPEPMLLRRRERMRTEVPGARLSRGTAIPRTPNIRRRRKEQRGRYRLPQEAGAPRRWVRTVTLLPPAKPQTATSMRPRTEMFTRTQGVAGSKPRAVHPGDMGNNRHIAAGQPLAAERADGNRERTVLVARKAVEAEADLGAAADRGCCAEEH
jgi:hypothetical protein